MKMIQIKNYVLFLINKKIFMTINVNFFLEAAEDILFITFMSFVVENRNVTVILC